MQTKPKARSNEATDADLRARAESARRDLLDRRAERSARPPLRFWRQQAHFTTPASGAPAKAIRGLAPVERLLDRFGIAIDDVAEASGAPVEALRAVLDKSDRSPLVMVDAEDAIAPTPEATRRAREEATRVFRDEDWGPTLAFYRPSGLALESCVDDLHDVLIGAGEGRSPEAYPIDGVIWPKVESADEIEWVGGALGAIERRLDLPENRIKLEFLIESGAAAARALEIAEAAAPRLVGVIWGVADYSADIGLPAIRRDHPMCDWARAAAINAAGAVGVPAIDAMTLNYPTPIHRGDDLTRERRDENRAKILGALAEVYADAQAGAALGMSGKWVGHPLQLWMVMAAYRDAIEADAVARDLEEIAAYRRAVDSGAGAAILGAGERAYMADRATDRHLRARLRKATAWGAIDPARAFELDLVSIGERNDLDGTPTRERP